MRSAAEIRFRMRQELANVVLRFAAPDAPEIAPGHLAPLPDPVSVASALRGTAFREQVRRVAEAVMEHRFPALGLEIDVGPDIRWRRDYVSGIETEPRYLRFIPYLDPAAAGDHKVIWEINRHQHLVALAQEFLFSRERRFVDEIVRQMESWWRENPFQRGINWTSALEVAFRALSWIWIWHFVSPELPVRFRRRFVSELYRHGLHLEYNLSLYFSPNTHLLCEALCLHALGRLFPSLPRSARWLQMGAEVLARQIERQVLEDGSHFERTPYYHLYATDLFVLHAVLGEVSGAYRTKLAAMAEFLDALVGPSGRLPLIGDDDGGRLFHPYSDRREYALETLAACGRLREPRHGHALAAWWGGPVELPKVSPRVLSDLVVWTEGDVQVIFDAGPFGADGGGHSHADTLSLLLRCGPEEVLIDPGTYTYVGSAEWRRRFRGTAMHNTVRIDGLDQAEGAGPFGWRKQPEVRLVEVAADVAVGECRYDGFMHRRTVMWERPSRLTVIDEVEGPAGEHRIEQFWHAGAPVVQVGPCTVRVGGRAVFTMEHMVSVVEGGEWGWRSPVLGVKEEAQVVVMTVRGELPVRLRAEVEIG
jgi:hypothetical protein